MIKKITWTIIILLLANLAWSQSKQIHFKRLTIDDGLSLSSVYCIYQDSKGFMWFGTEDGLNRFDGKNFRIFRPDASNPNSISHKWINQIYEDKSGQLWFGSRGGITSFNSTKEIFTQYERTSEYSQKISNDTIICTLEDNNKNLWVGTLHGLNQINIDSKETIKHNFQNQNLIGLRNRINDIVLDNAGDVWIGTDLGLYYYDNQSNTFNKVDLNITDNNSRILSLVFNNMKLWIGTNNGLISYQLESQSIEYFLITKTESIENPNQIIKKLYIDSRKNLWISNTDGLYVYNKINNRITNYIHAPEVSNSQAINPIKPILEDSIGNIWYGTFGTGLYKIDSTGFISNYNNNPGNHKSLSSNSVHSIFRDRAGVLWFGSFGAGINIYDPQSHKFDLITNKPNNINSLSSNFVWAIMEANDGSVWIGTNNNGLSRYFPKTGKFIHYTHNPNNPKSLSNSTVRYIFQDSKDNIWIATNGGGLNKFISNTGEFKHYLSSTTDNLTISNNFIRGIYEDKDDFIWVGTINGLNKFDPETGKFKRFLNNPDDSNSLSHNYIYTGLHQDNKGNLWIGTIAGGLNKLNIQNETFKSYTNDPNNPESISDDMIFWIYEDQNEILWIGTNSGLNRFDPKTEKFKRFGIKEGIPSDVVYGILPDEENNIWLSTNYGLSRFNLLDYTSKNYDISDGLQSNEFNGGALHLGKSGMMYFGGVYGLNSINPKELKINKNNSEIAITKFELFGKSVNVLDPSQTDTKENSIIELDETFYFHESISYTKEIVLDYTNNFFSLEFAALNTSLPDKVRYSYIMENLDKDWNYSGGRNFVSYARLKPGKYTFKVRAQNPDGLWSDSVAELKIIIKPPFWLSWWFICIEIFIAFNLVMLIYRYLLKSRTNKLLQAQNDEITKVNFQLCESERSLKELNDTKDKFFSIISHDLKNPFSSLLSISESVAENFNDFDDEDKLTIFNKIHVSVKHIYELLNNLLTWSRSQSDKVNFEPVEFNLSQVIETNINLHKIPAEKKGINLVANYGESISSYADREMINTVIRNLLSNALKFSSKGGSIEIETKKENSFIEVLVKDQGTGISEENLHKLFRIDMKFKSTGTSGEKGTGLGLILCKEFVEKNKGKIKVNSKLREGSVFSFTVPCN